MIRGTTAPFRIKLPYTIGELEWVTIKWWQDGNKGTSDAPLPITKKLAHCAMSNIYKCELSNDIIQNEQYYFMIERITYCFIAPQNIGAGTILQYDARTQTLTVGNTIINLSILAIDHPSNMNGLIFINEACHTKELYVTLSAEETMRFSDRHKAKMQLRGKLASNGRIFGCKPRLLTVYPISDDLLNDDKESPETDDYGWIVLDGPSITDNEGGEQVILDGKSITDSEKGVLVVVDGASIIT